jgi:L-arabinose isomerase
MLNQNKPQVGLLPFYLKLYDDISPERGNGFEEFLNQIVAALTRRGADVRQAPVCRISSEFENAIKDFENSGVDCIFTLHLAYSPSLESIEAFCSSELPIVILDVTMDASFGMSVSPARIMYNHGIHGVMDFANMLKRRKKPFEIIAGHGADNAVLDRAAAYARAAKAARSLRSSRVVRIGETFNGMGDFAVDPEILQSVLGITTEQIELTTLDAAVETITAEDVQSEILLDQQRYLCDADEESHTNSVRVGLGLRKLLSDGGYSAFSINFQGFNSAERPADTMPFLEICKAMERGTGYAGEGDLLTAALVGALASAFDAVTFTEIFCPDWQGNTLFLSHMGEINPALAGEKPRLFKKPFILSGAHDPAVLTFAAKSGPAVYVNLAPLLDDQFALIVTPVTILKEDATFNPALSDAVRIWMKPTLDIASFLEEYSRAGGTHHSALVLGDCADALAAFGRMSGMKVLRLG